MPECLNEKCENARMIKCFNVEMFYSSLLKHCKKGSAEDELNDSEPQFAKIRPMRVEMYGMNWNE